MKRKSAIDRLIQPAQPRAHKNHEWAAILDGLRASAAKRRRMLNHSERLAKRGGAELGWIAEAKAALAAVETDIESCDCPTTAAWITEQLMDIAYLLGVAAGTRGGLTKRARDARKKGHEGSEKTKAKAEVHELWKDWKAAEDKYKGDDDFALAMMDKFHGTLDSSGTIKNWCTGWKKEAAMRQKK